MTTIDEIKARLAAADYTVYGRGPWWQENADDAAPDMAFLLAELATARADLARVTEERDDARCRANASSEMAMRAEEMAVMAPPPRVRDSIAWLVGFASARADTRYPVEEVRQWLEAAPKDGVDVFTALDAAIARAEAAERREASALSGEAEAMRRILARLDAYRAHEAAAERFRARAGDEPGGAMVSDGAKEGGRA